mmetsp:Transcript_31700/g.51281  ORF Transcript_31700/g.51281 Transcript_31700/m.51281 type:complete len:89 (+) Transcript_31700:2545-2811(+)
MHILLSNGKITIICHMFWALSVNSPLGSKKVPAREIMLMHNSNFLSATMMASECKQMKRVPSCGAYEPHRIIAQRHSIKPHYFIILVT